MPTACAIGAIVMATDDGAARSNAAVRLGALIRATEDLDIIDWNDAPKRTAGEVVAALRKAAFTSTEREKT